MKATKRGFLRVEAMPDPRAVLDSMVQSSTVELFQAHGVAVAPSPQCRALPRALGRHIGGLVSFAGSGLSGHLVLLIPETVFPLFSRGGSHTSDPLDWTRELTNQLLGRIKNRLLQFQITLRSGLPTALSGAYLERRGIGGEPFAMYSFRTLRGELFVALSGSIDFSIFVYSGFVSTANEGDIILF